MARSIEFTEADFHLAGALFDRLRAKPGVVARIGRSYRWLVVEPAGGSPDASFEVNAGEGDPDAYNLIVNVATVEPGRPVYPELAARGVTTPPGWQLVSDVGWVIGWRLPLDTSFEAIAGFGFRATRALAGSPEDGRWRARVEKRGPRPGYAGSRI